MKKIILVPLILLTTFSFIHAQFSQNDSVPVRISHMDGERSGNTNQVNWAVSCFLQYAKFEIQRSQDGAAFQTIHSFQADELRCRQPFSYSDIQSAEKSFYRIKVGDVDGRFYSSKTIALYGQIKGFDITSINPTIITHDAVLNLSSSSSGKAEIIITSAAGIIIKRASLTIQKGNNSIPLQFNTLQKGIYFISATNSEGNTRSSMVIKN
jgi:hypothetical protein